MAQRVAIIGGGITGLAAAQRLFELDATCQISLFEAAEQLGGVLRTERRDGWLIERSADMFTTREPEALRLCQRMGFADQLIPTNNEFRQAFVVRRGRLVPVPEGFTLMSPARVWPVLTTPLLSPLGKLRLAAEYFVPAKRDSGDESLLSFATRRFGREAYERLIQPLIGGIYTADPTKLSISATMPQFLEMERKHGSCIRALRAAEAAKRQAAKRQATTSGAANQEGSGARYGLFVAPRDGMSSFIQAIAARLPAGTVRLNTRVQRIAWSAEKKTWHVATESTTTPIASSETWPRTEDEFDHVIVTVRADLAARLLAGSSLDANVSSRADGKSPPSPLFADLVAKLGKISLAGASVVVAGYRRDQMTFPLNGFGFVVPAIERRRILAGSFASVKFSGRAPDGHVLIRTFVGGALQPELLSLNDNDTKTLVAEELRDLLGLRGEPLFADVVRWHGTMPQYHVGHETLVADIDRLANQIPNFHLIGNAYHGVGIPFCVRAGEGAAQRLCSQMR